ncbi:glycosyltransferase family 4 protein [Candidatus Roizmanbacteria bacterium]|nr:glycosyltransferase family 4 protein [Candidatus Roizmanbacteria bacterium]
MKVLYLYMFPLWGNGSGAWLRRLTRHLTDNFPDYEAAIVAPEKRMLKYAKIFRLEPPLMGIFVGHPELLGVKKYSKFSNQEMIEIFNYYLLQTSRAIEKFKPDLIHAFHTAFLPQVARIMANFYKIPFIITTHGSDLYYLKEDSRWRLSVRDSSLRAKWITANSNFTRQWYLQMFGRDLSKKTRTIPAGVNNMIDFGKNVSWIDKKYHFKYDHMVLFTGRLTQHKGVEYLIKAARQIKAEIVILGDGPERKYLESLINKYKLTNVHMLGYFSQKLGEIDDFYLRSDIYVAPSVWNEPLGLVILEAMVHKTPVIVTRKGGVSTIVKDDMNGFLVRPKSASIIAQKVNQLLKDDKLRYKMGENAYRTVSERFNWGKIAGKFYRLYQRSMNNKRPPRAPTYVLAAIKKIKKINQSL